MKFNGGGCESQKYDRPRTRKRKVFQITRRTRRNRHHSRNNLLFQIGPEFRHHLFYDIIGNTGLPGKIAKRQCRLAYRIDDLLRFENVKVFRHRNEVLGAEAVVFPSQIFSSLTKLALSVLFLKFRHFIALCTQ